MLNRIFNKVFHPIFLSLFPVLPLYSSNIDELNLKEIWHPILISILLTFAFWGIFNLVLKNLQKSAILASIFFLLFASYSHIIGGIILKFAPNIPNRYFLFIFILMVILLGILLSKLKSNLNKATVILNTISISLLIMPFITIGWKEFSRTKYNLNITPVLNLNQTNNSLNYSYFPDIYYIIVDRYPSFRVTKQNYLFDNSSFMQVLEKKGFTVVLGSRANYPFTTTSLASTLNMRFLDEIQAKIGPDSTDSTPFLNLIENNEVIHYLKSKGYTYLHFGPDYGPTFHNKNADYNYHFWQDSFKLSEFSRRFIDQTAINPLLSFITRLSESNIDPMEEGRLRNFYATLDQLNEAASTIKIAGPKFVFIHSFLTHEPLIFNEDGNYLPAAKAGQMDQRELLINQVKAANRYLEEFIGAIQNNSENPPIIVLQSDEGPYPERYMGNLPGFNWKKATDSEINEKFRIINAYFLPRVEKGQIQLSKTPVNTFRIIFNLYFGENLPLLEDRSFAQVGASRPYEFFEITDKLR